MKEEHKKMLRQLAEVLFPLQAWLEDPARSFKPSPEPPWRAPGAKLSINDLDVITFVEDLLSGDDEDEAIEARWNKVLANPLKEQEEKFGRKSWRKSRKAADGTPLLETHPAKVVFGAAASGNFILVEETIKPLTRGRLYEECLPALATVVAARKPADAVAWDRLADDLFRDRLSPPNPQPHWPADIPLSSEFIKQFSKDVLYAALGFKGGVPAPLGHALSLEAGEARRPGNAFTSRDALDAVSALKKKLREVAAAPPAKP